MITLASIITRFKDSFLEKYKDLVLPGHMRALHAMEHCRDIHGPHMMARCSDPGCSQVVYIPHSCGHRNCPHCQNHESQQWIQNQLGKRLPSTYWLITFTLPLQLRDLAWKNQRTIYSIMFACVQQTLKAFVQNDKRLGGAAGMEAILHTHSRDLNYHPHIHVLMPAASIDMKSRLWRTNSQDYLFNHKALAKVFRAKLLQAIVDEKLPVPKDCPQEWAVHCKKTGNGEKAVIYLGRYLYRGVIMEKDIMECKNGLVTYRYLHAKTNKYKTKTVTGEEFLYLLMLHILPKGFRRVRSYGFLHPCSKKLIHFLQVLLHVKPFIKLETRPSITCPRCGKAMKIVHVMIPWQHNTIYCT